MRLSLLSPVVLAAGVLALTGIYGTGLLVAQQQPPPAQGQAGRQGGGGAGAAGQRGQQPGQQPARDALAQPAPIGTATISGTVAAEGTGTPVRRARVTLNGAELRGRSRTAQTDDQGRFTFIALPAGRYTMSASKPGYVDISYGAKKPGRAATPIQVDDGQKIERANINLPKGSVVTGVVIDENGEPSPATQVRAFRYVMRTGERTLQQSGSDTTDDRGIYRIYGLQPGDYIISAAPRNTGMGDVMQTVLAQVESALQQAGVGGGRGGANVALSLDAMAGRGGRGQQELMDQAALLQQQLQAANGDQQVAYAPVYYPGTTSPSSATTVTLTVGEERPGIDFQLQLVPTAKVEGAIIGPDGSVPPGTQVRLVPNQPGMSTLPGLNMNQTRVDQTGRFSFQNVTPGQYTVSASAQIRPGQTQTDPAAAGRGRGVLAGFGPAGRGGMPTNVLWASVDISVNGQTVPDIVMNLQSGMIVSGRVAFETSTLPAPTDLTRVRVTLQPQGQQVQEMPGPQPAQVDANGHFTFIGVAPGRYLLRGSAPSGVNGTAGMGQASQTPGWVLKSALLNGRDVLDFPLEVKPNEELSGAMVTFTDRTQELSGTLQDATGKPTSDFTIIIFPLDNRYWVPSSRRISSARPGTDGKYTFRNLPPGEYRLTAVTDAEPGEWYDPAFLSQLMNASMAITLREGEKKVQDMKLAGR